MKPSHKNRNCVSHNSTLFKTCLLLVFFLSTLFLNPVKGEYSNHLTLENEEDVTPIAVCQNLFTTLDFSGTKSISPQNVNGGSFDPDGSIVSYSLDQDFFTCDDIGVNVVTLTVEDNDGNTASCSANVTVSFPSQTLACISQVNLSLSLDGTGILEPDDVLAGPFFDPCNLFVVTPSFFTCDDLGLNTVTVEDGQGNSCWLTVLVEDKIPPSFIFPEDVTVECSNTDPSITGEPIIIDNCGQYGTAYEDQFFPLGGGIIKILRTWTIIEWLSGEVQTYVQIIETLDATPPTLVCFSTINVSLDATGNVTILPEFINAGAFDDCGTITYEVSPSEFDCSDVGSTVVVFLTATDQSGNSNQCWGNVTIEDKLPPTAICNSNVNVSLGADGTATITPDVIDAGSFDNCDSLNYELSQSTFDCSDIGESITVILTVTDQSGNSNQCFALVNVEDKTAPEIIWPVDVVIDCSQAGDINPQITGLPIINDNCNFTAYSYQDEFFDLGAAGVKILRNWAVIDWLSGIVQEHVQIIKILYTTGPSLVCFDNVNVSLDATGNVTILPEFINADAFDDCGTITYEVSPSEFDCSDVGSTVVVFLTATDQSGNSNQCWGNVTIEDKLPPTAICNSNVNVSLGADGTATITPDVIDAGSFDNCDSLNYELSQSTFDCSDIGESITVILTVTDQSGNSNQCFAFVNVEDKMPPEIIWPVDVVIDCSQAGDINPQITGLPIINDNCNFTAYSYQDEFFDLGAAGVKILRNWAVIDWLSGIVQEHVQIIKILDTTGPSLVCFDNVNVSLDATGNVTILPEFINAGAFDDCGTISYEVSPSEFDCSDVGSTVVVFLTATDQSGNSNQCWGNVTIEDKLPPTAICNSNVNVSLGADGTTTITPDVIDAGSFDNCDSLNYELSQSTFDCSDIGESITVILTVTDQSGNSNQCFALVNVEDKIPPSVTCPPDLTIDCADAGNIDPEITGFPEVTDNCDLIGFSYEDQIIPNIGANSKVIRKWTIVDWYSNSFDSCFQVINIQDFTAPDLVCLDQVTVALDLNGSLTLFPQDLIESVSDQCDSVSITLSPSQFDCSNVGDNTVIVTATDGSGNFSECFITVTIQDNKPPTPICLQSVNVSLGADGTATLSAESIDGGSFDGCGGPVSLSISPSTFDCSNILDNGTLVTLTVTDESGNSDFCITQVFVEDKMPPSVTCPPDLTIDCADAGNIDPEITGFPEVTDNCDLIGFSYEDQIIPNIGANSKVIRKWTIVDWYSNSFDSCFQVINIQDFTAPDLVCLDQVTVALDLNGSLTLFPQDLIESVSDLCDSVSITLFPSQFDCSNVGDNTVIVTATDGSGNFSECFVTVTIQDNKPPTPICLQSVNVSLGADGTATLSAESIDGGSFDGCGGPVSLSISPSTFDCSNILDNGTLVTLTVTDESGNSDFCITQVFVEDKMPPSVTCPPDLTIDCADAGNIDPEITGFPEVTDNCDLIGFSYEDQIIPNIGANSKVIRKWTIVDWYSNSFDSCFQVINIQDFTAPDLVCLDQVTVALDLNGSLTLFAQDLIESVSDQCDSVSITLSPSQFDCSNVGDNTVIVTATDGSGNFSECFVTVTIQDNKPPTPICLQSVNVSLGADGTATLSAESLDGGSFDGCGGPVSLSISPSTFDCSNILDNGTLVTLTVTDESGNSDFCITQVFVEDKMPPIVTCPFDLTIECSQASNLDPILTGSPFVEDNCDLIGLSYEDSIIELQGANYKVVREWTIVDWYSNSFDSCTQEIYVVDETPPNIICLNQLSANLDANGSLTLFPGDLDANTSDECGSFDLSISQSQFDCSNVGSNMVTLIATDENGNSSQCVVEVLIFGLDSDGDGFSTCNGDCNDNDASIAPNAPELCGDNIDNNCNGAVDENCICASLAESTQYEWIESIDVNGTANVSGNDNGYGDYTSITLPMNIGSNDIILNPGFSGSSYDEFWSVWIDLNQNGQYESSEEVLAQSSNGQIISTINIPSSSSLGTTTMRISMKYGSSSDPCEIFAEGEVEDYTVDISGPTYCNSEGQSTQYEWIKKVRLKNINNLSGNDNGYADFTNLSTNLNPGQSKNIRLKPGFSDDSYLEYWRVWVDWNEDGDFDDSGELEVEVASTGNITDQITVPNSASSGNKIMRVSMKYDGYADPCDVFAFGEVEDYTIFITGNNPLVSQSDLSDAISMDNDHAKTSTEDIETRELSRADISVKLFPNPTSNYINIEINSSSKMDNKLIMYNELGQIVYQATTDLDNHVIDVTQNKFLNGVYMIIIQQGDQVLSKKVIVTK